jgi:hypothetical protein
MSHSSSRPSVKTRAEMRAARQFSEPDLFLGCTSTYAEAMKDAKLKDSALKATMAAVPMEDASALIRSAHAAGMRKYDIFEMCRHITNCAARVSFGAGLVMALAHELAADEDDLAEPQVAMKITGSAE